MSQNVDQTTPGLSDTVAQARAAYEQAMQQSAARQTAAREFIQANGASVVDGHAPVTAGVAGTN